MPRSNGNDAGAIAIWIDHRAARLIELDNGEAHIRTIESDAEEVPRSFGHVANQPPHHGFAGDKEKHADARRRQQLEQFYARVADEAAGAPGAVVVLGPGLARKEFEKSIGANHALAGRIEKNEPADANLTENQVVATARKLLGQPPARAKRR